MPALTVENCVRHGRTNLLSKFTHGSRFRSLGFFLRNWKKREETSGRRMKDAVCQAHFNCITSLSNYRVILICNWNDDRFHRCLRANLSVEQREMDNAIVTRKQKWTRPRKQQSEFNHDERLPLTKIIFDNRNRLTLLFPCET